MPSAAFDTEYMPPIPTHTGASSNKLRFEDTNTSFVSDSDPNVELWARALIRRRGSRNARATNYNQRWYWQ